MAEAICRISSCARPVLCRRLCEMHYDRLYRNGRRRVEKPSLTERIWSRVQRGHVLDCWPWYGSTSPKGYGKISVDGVPRLVTRIVFAQTYGYLPPAVRHRCDNPPCVNPAHLLPGTIADNNADMAQRRRAAHGDRHPHTTLTAELVREIRATLATGRLTQREIAERFGVRQQTVSEIHRRRSWRHLDSEESMTPSVPNDPPTT